MVCDDMYVHMYVRVCNVIIKLIVDIETYIFLFKRKLSNLNKTKKITFII